MLYRCATSERVTRMATARKEFQSPTAYGRLPKIAAKSLLLPFLLSLVAVSGSGPARADDIPLAAAVYHVHRPGGIHKTYLDIAVGKAFAGKLPDAIDSIAVTGPAGDLALGREDFGYNPRWRAFWAVLPGKPALGEYRFEVTSGDAIGNAGDTQARVTTIPVPAPAGLRPVRGEIVACPTTVFSWPRLDHPDPLFYQLQIRDAAQEHVFRSDYVRDASGFRLPPDVLAAGAEYQWRLRVADGPDWQSLNNRSHSKWMPLTRARDLASCSYPYQVPPADPGDWPVASLAQTGFDTRRIETLRARLFAGHYPQLHSLLLVKDGKLVLEEYFYGNARQHPHHLMSVTKSVTSVLIGLALAQQHIADVDVAMVDFFPAYRESTRDADLRRIRLKHVLAMNAGLDWNTWIYPEGDPRDSTTQMTRAEDWIEHVLQRRIVAPPGERFVYSNGLSMLLGEILRHATGQQADRYAAEQLFAPLGIDDFRWRRLPGDLVDTAGGLYLRSRDMARIGYLMLRQGRWNGRQILPAEWVRRSTAALVSEPVLIGSGYGYQWWRGQAHHGERRVDLFYAAGKGGQYIFVCPELDLVAVFTSQAMDNPMGEFPPQIIMAQAVIPALLPAPKPAQVITLDLAAMDRIGGSYGNRFMQAPVKIYREGNALHYASGDDETGLLLPLSPTRFMVESPSLGPLRAEFQPNERGEFNRFSMQVGFGFWQFDRLR